MSRRYRLAYVVSHPIQYQAPLLRYIASEPEIDLAVFFLSDLSVRGRLDRGFGIPVQWDVPLLDGYTHHFLPTLGRADQLSFWRPVAYGLRSHLETGGFDALWLHGYSHYIIMQALAVAKLQGIKVLFRSDSHLKSDLQSRPKRWFKERIVPRLFRAIDGFLAIGTLNREYYVHYGAPEERIFMMPYAVDNAFFQSRADKALPYREAMREELGLEPGRAVILYASKFQPRKRPHDLLEAYIRLSPDGVTEPSPHLLFIGDGEERPRLEARARRLGWSTVKFQGFQNQTQLPRYYDLCDVFVLPSEYEPWGLVVNEAMNAGKPLIISDHVGAGPDLVRDGTNGFVVPVGDVAGLADRLKRLTTDPELARRMGRESRRRIAEWSFETDLRVLLQALAGVVGR